VTIAERSREAPRVWSRSAAGTASGSRRVRRVVMAQSLVVDVLLIAVAYHIALMLFAGWHRVDVEVVLSRGFDWGSVIAALAIVGTFLALGLYCLEAYVSRTLHLLLLGRGTMIALLLTAFLTFVLNSPSVSDSRLTVFAAFATFFVLDAGVRLWLLDRTLRADMRARRGGTLLIGWNSGTSHLALRCADLRGFVPMRECTPSDRRGNGHDVEERLVETIMSAEPPYRQIFLDVPSLGYKAVFDLIEAALGRGSEVYVTGRAVSPLDPTRLLTKLFELPVMRVHRMADPAGPIRRSKRLFDVALAAAALLLLAPLLGVVALLIRAESPGPVFYRQTRVGRGGRTFCLLKFRSMKVDNDAGLHREATISFIAGDLVDEMSGSDEWGRPVYKMTRDDRVTRVGRWLRKYSLDELPQLWNVLRGEMSIIGPRPALEYEVAAYEDWHWRRLDLVPGLSGLWQVAGRSRVGFDEMVFQDIMYGYSQGLLTDIGLTLQTLPAALMGRGAA
jgi:lipopolysaccharide/colanic/teichoic acid biosynthesis glycosyltransferase